MGAPRLVIAGAGIAGLALAAAVRDTGVARVLLDERPALGSTGGAITLWPNAMAALDEIGVGAEIRAVAAELDAGTIRSSSGAVLRALDAERTRAALGGPLVAVRRGVLIEALHARAGDAEIRLGVAARGFRRDGVGVRVLTDSGSVRGDALVGADGYRSGIARTLHPGLAERYAGYPAWRGLARAGGLGAGQFWGAGREFGIIPLDDATAYWYATHHEAADGVAEDEVAHLRAVFAGWPSDVRAVLEAEQAAPVTRTDVMDRAVPRRWADGPVALIGDAAHAMRPHLGQGGAQALVDAAVLAGELRTAADPAAAFARYERRRRRTGLRAVRLSRAAGRAINAPDALHRLVGLVPDAVLLRGLARVAGRTATR